ncbi:MAG: T9SS type A sorting domain-containing protein [Cyclobacteriaceae bacterium]|nr:T9SS type A sorting domain-containing protein [Cyclobacteriaceae bacterium]
MGEKYFLWLFCFFFIHQTGYTQSWKVYPYNPQGSLLSFPEDEGRHEGEPIEWWYTSGHLTGGTTGNQYSFMVSYFYYPAYGYDGFRIFNLSNENTGEFYNNTSPMTLNELGTDSLNINATVYPDIEENWKNKADESGHMIPFEYLLSAASADASLDLEYVLLKRPLILGDSGLFYQGSSSYTYYYSLTKSEVRGEISFNGITEPVTGTSWIDRQFGSFNPLTQEDYEWFCIQLSNEMDINLWNIFSWKRELPEGPAYRLMAVYVDENTEITTDNFEIDRLSYHYMPDSARCYAQKWRLTSSVQDMDLVITTFHHNSEVKLPFRFFEGSTLVTGTVNGIPVTGKGFAELLHSYQKPEIELKYPIGSFWNSNRPISWRLQNPDDGRPLKYNLECSTDNRQTFFKVGEALTDTSFYWNEPDLMEGDSCWFRITAFSIDSVLIKSVVSNSPSAYNPNLTAIGSGKEGKAKWMIKIYPNPANEKLIIDLPEIHPFISMQIVTDLGQIISEMNSTEESHMEIETGNLPAGVYLIRFFSPEETISSRFLIR